MTKVVEALQHARNEIAGYPQSLGYSITALPKIDKAIPLAEAMAEVCEAVGIASYHVCGLKGFGLKHGDVCLRCKYEKLQQLQDKP